MKRILIIGLILMLALFTGCKEKKDVKKRMAKSVNPVVKVETNKGIFYLELFEKEAPITVKNFLTYTKDDFYNGTIFHRVINGFMIQGGGFIPGMEEKPVSDPIKNEAGNGLSNKRGTVAMARTSVVDSATAQFFVNVVDNSFLDHRSDADHEFGYAVFGKIIEGMDVIDSIKDVRTTQVGYFSDVPAEDVIIISIKVADK